jgi:hypothetical protein
LPDGIFSYQKAQFWYTFRRTWNGKYWYILWPFGIFYGHVEFLIAIWYILCSIFPRFGMLQQQKSGNPGFYLEGRSTNPEFRMNGLCFDKIISLYFCAPKTTTIDIGGKRKSDFSDLLKNLSKND